MKIWMQFEDRDEKFTITITNGWHLWMFLNWVVFKYCLKKSWLAFKWCLKKISRLTDYVTVFEWKRREHSRTARMAGAVIWLCWSISSIHRLITGNPQGWFEQTSWYLGCVVTPIIISVSLWIIRDIRNLDEGELNDPHCACPACDTGFQPNVLEGDPAYVQ